MHSEHSVPDSPSSSVEIPANKALPVKTPARSGGRRTHRACDRCRVKKSKCNGQQPCNTCRANERTCVFSALRRRDIRKWHCHMHDTVDEAIQRLYRACKESSSFPGVLPDENNGYVTTESILQAMGFTNLELGPRTGVPLMPVASSLPLLQTQGTDPSYGLLTSNTTHTYPDRCSPTTVSSNAPTPDPRLYHNTPYHQPNAGSGISPQTHSSGYTEGARGMSEQFQDAMGRQLPRDGYDNPHQYFRPSPYQLVRSSPQHVTQLIPDEHPKSVHYLPDAIPAAHNHTNSKAPRTFGERFSSRPDACYNVESYINPAQVWTGYHDYTTVTQ